MLGAEIIRTMVDYNYSYQQLLWDSIMTLTDEQFAADIPYSHGSVRNHMVHLAGVDRRWLRGLQEVPDARAYNPAPEDFPSRAQARELCESVAADVRAYVAGLDDAALQKRPRDFPITVWETLLHIVNHGTDHRSQVLRALHDLGAPTFEQDFAFYLFKRLG